MLEHKGNLFLIFLFYCVGKGSIYTSILFCLTHSSPDFNIITFACNVCASVCTYTPIEDICS